MIHFFILCHGYKTVFPEGPELSHLVHWCISYGFSERVCKIFVVIEAFVVNLFDVSALIIVIARMQCCAERDIVTAIPYVCPSVCQSGTRRYFAQKC